MHIPWDDVQVFLAVVDAGSLSRAARALGLTQPTVSRRLAEIEQRIGEPLFVRGATGSKLSPFGERMLAPARRMAECAGELERAIEKADERPSGVVRITALPGLAYDFVAPFAAWLRGELPDIRLEVKSTIQYLDLARRDADLALRTDRALSKDLVILSEVKTTVAAFATRAYVDRLPPRPKLDQIDWIGWAPPLEELSPNRELSRLVPGFAPAFASDDFLVQLRAARAGVGAIFMGRARHRFSVEPDLEEIDVDLPPIPASLYLVSTRSALAIPRVRAVADLLVTELDRTDTRPTRGARRSSSEVAASRKREAPRAGLAPRSRGS